MTTDNRPSIAELRQASSVEIFEAKAVLLEIAEASLAWRGTGPRDSYDAKAACIGLLNALSKVRP